MKRLTVALVNRLATGPGRLLAAVIVWFVTVGFFLTQRRGRAISRRFFHALLPEKRALAVRRLVWRQYKSFAAQYLDRARYHQGQPLHFQPLHLQKGGGSEDNPRLLEEAISRGRNGVLLMSHVGNWEAGALSLREKGIPVMILLGAKAGEAMDGAMRDGLQRQGVELVAVDERSGDPLHIISAYRFLRTRGMVAMSADRLWQPDQPALVRPFLGGTVRLPRGPFALAYAVQAPMYVFFILRAGAMCYREIVFPPIEYAEERRGPKETALEHAADQYLSRLREVLRRHPEHWHHFQPFVDFGESDGAAP